MRLWRPNLSKIKSKMDNFHFRDDTKILHPSFAYILRFFYCATQSFFLLRIIYFFKWCKLDHFERSYEVLKSKLKEVMRFWSQNLSKISHSKDNKKYIAKKNPDLSTRFCNRKYTYILFWPNSCNYINYLIFYISTSVMCGGGQWRQHVSTS